MSLPTVVFITALPCEFKAVKSHLTDPKEDTHPKGTIYEVGEYQAKSVKWRVAVAEIGQTNPKAAQETERAIQYFSPAFAFFVGVAGGVKDVKLGDVVAAETVRGYERGKKTSTGFQARSDVCKSTYDLVQRARATARKQEWSSEPKALVAVIAAGEKVIASTETETFGWLKENFGDVVAVEMEGIGFLTAIEADRAVSGIVIRGISDLLENKTSKKDKKWQPIAAKHAAAFAFAMLDDLIPPTPHKEIDKTTSDDAVKPASSLIFKLDQDDRNLDSYRLQAWFGNYVDGKSLEVKGTFNDKRKDELPVIIHKIVNQLFLENRVRCDKDFTIEFFLPKELLCTSVEQWIIDSDIDEKLGDCYKLVIRSTERFEKPNMLRRLKNCWGSYPNILQLAPKQRCCGWSDSSDCKEAAQQFDKGNVFFVLDFTSDAASIFKPINCGVPFLLWPTDSNHSCHQATEELLSCNTFEELPTKLKELRLGSNIANVSLLWDDPNKIPPFSEFSPHNTKFTSP